MADLDAELLALAGDASSDEEDAPMNISGAPSLSPDARNRDGSARPGKKAGRRGGRSYDNDSEEEGEASSGPGSPDSLQSAPMDESDSDSDTSPANVFDNDVGNEADKYPLEGKFMNEEDREAIMKLPEIKREEILAERAQEIETNRQNRALRQLMLLRENESKKQDKKRKAGAADLEETTRKTSRQRTKVGGGRVGESSSGIGNLMRARAEKDDRQRRRREDIERNKERRNLGYDDLSDVDADGDSDLDWDKNKGSPSPDFQDAQPATLRDYERIRVGRYRFAEVCFYPGFEDAITGCYIRVSVGRDHDNGGETVYRMAVIKGFTEGRLYTMESKNGRRFQTNQYVRASVGKTEKTSPFIHCSDSPFTENEVHRFQAWCHTDGVPLPPLQKLQSKAADVNKLINRTWTEEELQEKLKRSGVLASKQLQFDRARIRNEIKDATASGALDRVEELKTELDKLEGSMPSAPKKATGVQPNMEHRAQQERLAILNFENRKKNIEEVRQAQINERRAAKRNEAALARGEAVVEDHSRRVKTRAKFKHDVSESAVKKKEGEDSGTNSPAVGTPKIVAKSTIPTFTAKPTTDKKGLPGLRRPLQDDDIIASIDFGIDLDLDL